MAFKEVITIDWYDGIIVAFCKADSGEIFYCSLVGGDDLIHPRNKIYLCINLRNLKGYEALLEIIAAYSFKENWNKLSKLIVLKNSYEECYLAKTRDLSAAVEFIRYKDNFRWPKKVLWGEFPDNVEAADKLDDWLKY
ncbi:hypothetical protein IDJ77_10490 [Mucilaginibacter sp. ZT4R22]|uniref:Uncharacterized protein n=1 Tax=Mucilaginibacter pankratovii TaxID=2772110 RepID=A0ABR7WPW2_9SPHI|nr:hypothetical protein [Mucilaginibacter pankratovii]MBD1364236.1 hypothetical protein [Mucilaginibacter pankratovii]